MTAADPTNPIDSLQQKLGASWNMIASGRSNAVAKRDELREALSGLDSDDSSIVVFGSLARDEFTSGSDIDWTLLIDGQASPEHLDNSLEVANYITKVEGKAPGREGTFGGPASSHELVYKIGGSDDTNRNTTQRILLLLESAALGRAEAYERVIKQVLRRYVQENHSLLHSTGKYSVPRFLQNDIARYWRTVAVDFAYKQRQRGDRGWALRGAKLRMSRKLTYVSGLLMCFSCEFDKHEIEGTGDKEPSQLYDFVEHLWTYSQKTPLEIVAHTLLRFPKLEGVARELFGTYNEFLELLNDKDKRDHLETLERDKAEEDRTYQDVRKLSHKFQGALTRLFLEENGTPLFQLTKTYGVF